jgi:voltage-gated potassium channel
VTDPPQALHGQRWRLLRQFDALTDRPITFLAFVWLILLGLDLTVGLSRSLQVLSYVIWGVFGLDFLVEFTIAPDKRRYLRRNWITGLSLLLPAFGTLRVFRALRALRLARSARAVSLLRLVTSLNRGIRATRHALGRRGLGYVVLVTLIVTLAGAAGMRQFESPAAVAPAATAPAPAGVASDGDALWWTAMLMTTLGSDYWPRTAEGRILTVLLAVYALAVFGYLAGSIASLFVGAERQPEPSLVSLQREVRELRQEVVALRAARPAAPYEPEPGPPRS